MQIVLDIPTQFLPHPKDRARVAAGYLRGIVDANRRLIRQAKAAGHPFPKLMDAGVSYRAERPGVESFATIPTVLQRGYGDCAHLSAWRVAECLEEGKPASIRIHWRRLQPNGVRPYHVTVRHNPPTGLVEDVSRKLGM